MEISRKPDEAIAKRTLPPPLTRAIKHLFAQKISDACLVGGTCLSGYYAGHRRSDDIDLFVKNETALRSAVLAAKSLTKIEAVLTDETQSKQYYHANCILDKYPFTIDIVQDANLFTVGKMITLTDGIVVVDLETLLRMKAATLVSRCSEKDLYDLIWLFEEFPELSVNELIQLGSSIDGGVNPENILASLLGTTLREEACGFCIDPAKTPKIVFAELKKFKHQLEIGFARWQKDAPVPKLKELVKRVKRVL